MLIRSRRYVTLIACAAAGTASQNPARAEEAPAARPADTGELQEITVTARYRSESLQVTPISISALSSGDLESRGITNVTDLTASVPSTTLTTEGSTGGNTLVAYIRGLGQSNFSPGFPTGRTDLR
jgi:iron complex outermembrane recepter protein